MDINQIFGEKINKDNLLQLNPLVLAFVGDGIHTAFVRTHLVEKSGLCVGDYHTKSAFYCKASTQSKVLDKITDLLTEDEQQIVKRARNTKSHNIAKNSSVGEYKKATCLEALIGWLFLSGQNERMAQILNYTMEI